MSNTPVAALDVENREYWRALCPALHVEDEIGRPACEIDDIDELLGRLRVEGYVNVPGVLKKSTYKPLRECIATLHRAGIPLAFAFVYDEMWLAFQAASRFIKAALGKHYVALPDFWVWHLNTSAEAAGFAPHRDRVHPTLDPDNSPHSLTVWLPFSDATPLNGCIYVLPAQHDDRFRRRVWDGPDNARVDNLQNIRAVPAEAGSLLAWNQAILHWGGRASDRAEGPRISAAFEFQRGDKPPFNEPLLDPQRIPSFEERLGLIGKQLLQYRHMYPLAPDVEALATELRDRFMGHVVGTVLPVTPGAVPPPGPRVEPALPSNGRQSGDGPSRVTDPKLLRDSMARRLFRRSLAAGQITVPAVPGMVDDYVSMCDALFAAVGSNFSADELDHLRAVLDDQAAHAYAETRHSTVTISYNAPIGTVLNYNVASEWVATREPPSFGSRPDARVVALANDAEPWAHPVLDIGASTGRNALALARRGHPVDAVEPTPNFAATIRAEAERDSLAVRVLQRGNFDTTDDLRRDYRLILLSEVVPEFRTTDELRRVFDLAARCLAPGGRLLFNAFLAHPDYTPDTPARQLAEQVYTSIFTWPEMNSAATGLDLELIANDSVYEYEMTYLPEGAWPRAVWYPEWVAGLDVFDLPREECPIEMRWLVYRKSD